MPILIPRSIRGQFMAALILFEIIVVGIFTLLLVRQQNSEMAQRMHRRLESQALQMSSLGALALGDAQPDSFSRVVSAMARSASVSSAQITDLQGRTLASTDSSSLGKITLSVKEKSYLRSPLSGPIMFQAPDQSHKPQWEAVTPILDNGQVRALAWIYPNDHQDKQDLRALLRITALWAAFVLGACTIIAAFLAQSTTRQLALLTRATRRLINNPEDPGAEFPLPVRTSTEAAELTIAFNRMVSATQDQRAGLNETLALLDSMLANAPIGFAFFDRKYRFVRVNQFLADMNGYSFALHLGRGITGILPPATAARLERCIETVFQTGEPVRDLELTWEPEPHRPRTWLAHLYPVRTETEATRWVGAILVDTTDQKRSEETLRRTEKLAATGRLAASIAHEINNPLEAVTNLLYLIRQEKLSPETAHFADLAQQEVTRVSEITQQTLRFYRQSTLPALTNISELLDSVITLHLGRVQTLQVDLHRDYAPGLQLFCFAGELRQLLANLIGNALDAMTPDGGRLLVRAHASHQNEIAGLRISVADTGCGISQETRRHIFEPFFTTKEATGTGLGLWVSEQIIRKHHGSVRVRSRDHGSPGTVFSIFFPATGVEPDIIPTDSASETVSS
ncbi:MAG TPA: ATP-binding protein [Acidobacteriaceae bacterium]|jgi:PAS domain S-box-containing protein|nr:ATP-binding protein [Acidobacteriaceae bacterium]